MTTTSAERLDVLAARVLELAERLHSPACAPAPLGHDKLLEREVVGRRGLDLDPRIDERVRGRVYAVQRVLEARPRRVLPRVLERVDEVPGDAEPIHEVRVAQIPIGGERRRVLAE